MGHQRLGTLPTSRAWQAVIALITGGADAKQVVAAVSQVAEPALAAAANDSTLQQGFWLMTQIPLAARESAFGEALQRLGLAVVAQPTITEIGAAVMSILMTLSSQTAGLMTSAISRQQPWWKASSVWLCVTRAAYSVRPIRRTRHGHRCANSRHPPASPCWSETSSLASLGSTWATISAAPCRRRWGSPDGSRACKTIACSRSRLPFIVGRRHSSWNNSPPIGTPSAPSRER
ncbi:MAG: hypothetical protein JWR10_899 [Rubritepida sp.]|nr:hypothetical protein [Rubritepida sp.]